MRPHVTQKKKEAGTTKPTGTQERDGATLAATWQQMKGRAVFFSKNKATKLLKIQDNVPKADKTIPISDTA
jgi:hypothetical protein